MAHELQKCPWPLEQRQPRRRGLAASSAQTACEQKRVGRLKWRRHPVGV